MKIEFGTIYLPNEQVLDDNSPRVVVDVGTPPQHYVVHVFYEGEEIQKVSWMAGSVNDNEIGEIIGSLTLEEIIDYTIKELKTDPALISKVDRLTEIISRNLKQQSELPGREI